MNPSSNEFRLCNSDEWRSGNHGGRVIIRGYGGGGDMVWFPVSDWFHANMTADEVRSHHQNSEEAGNKGLSSVGTKLNSILITAE
ncbi:hypothetical protein Tco_0833826, partial [Tanacetum coccineum]